MSHSVVNHKVKFVKAGDFVNRYAFTTEKRILEKGWTQAAGTRPLPIDLIWEKDVPIKLRDGVILYGDVFRALENDNSRQPALLPWSPYGKTGSGHFLLNMFPSRVGIPLAATSGLEKFEGPDPAEWCKRGYVVVNVDARGAFNSQGDIQVFGTQEGRDGYDTIEWIAAQSWCNGSVALAGNSWLGAAQWFIAAENPPHLKAIAPWEGLGDFYRESICRGGIPDRAFWNELFPTFGGKNQREDVCAMVDEHPLWNWYWEDKKPKLDRINVPIYATASYSTGLHTEGSFRGYLLSSSSEKWLRIHTTQEWHDLYQSENNDDLQRFFDHFMISANNGWENTPRIRLSLLGYNRPNVVNRPVTTYPPLEFQYQNFYLDTATNHLSMHHIESVCTTSYDAEARGGNFSRFEFKFDKYTELSGFSKVRLFMSTPDHDDMDVFVLLRKLDSKGNALEYFNIPFKDLPEGTKPEDIPKDNIWRYVGPNGRLRASHRATLPEPGLSSNQRKLLSDAYVWHPHDNEEKLGKNEIVELQISLWPGGIVFERDESMALEVSGFHGIRPEFEKLQDTISNYNVGRHIIHSGGQYPSSFLVAMSNH
ncbi:hypothetical protein ACHAO8_009847 [Botrytis cinerea]